MEASIGNHSKLLQDIYLKFNIMARKGFIRLVQHQNSRKDGDNNDI